MRQHLLAAAGAAFLAFSIAPAGAMPGGGAAGVQTPDANVVNAQWYEDRRWRRRGPPPWAPAYGRRYRDSYGWRGDYGRRGFYGRPYRGYGYYDRPYRRPGVVFRFGY